MRPSGANFRDSGKLRPARMVVTGAGDDDWASGKIQGPIESMNKMKIFTVIFRDGNLRSVWNNPQGIC